MPFSHPCAKKLVCECACRGWCTFWPVLVWLRWSCQALFNGVYPASRHDGSDWLPSDSARATLSGQRMPARFAFVALKGDWAEFCERLRLPNWSSGIRPCFCCSVAPDQLTSAQGVSMQACPWHINTDYDYEMAATRCELTRDISRDGTDTYAICFDTTRGVTATGAGA